MATKRWINREIALSRDKTQGRIGKLLYKNPTVILLKATRLMHRKKRFFDNDGGVLRRILPAICAVALTCGIALPGAVYAIGTSASKAMSVASEMPAENVKLVSGENTDENALASENETENASTGSDFHALAPEPTPTPASEPPAPTPAPTPIPAPAPIATAFADAASPGYPDGIDWQVIENGVGETGTCVWGMDAATKTLYIRPPDGAETGTLPSIYEVANDDKPATPWQTSGAKKAVILPGVIAGDRCSLFNSSLSLTEVEGLENLDISNTTTLAGMFLYCFALKEVKLPDWNAPNLVDMQYMFAMNNKLTEIKFGNMYAPKLESLEATFWACETLETVDLSGLDAPNITNMVSTFSQDWKLVTIIWPEHLDTSKVLYLYATFEECRSLGHLDLSGFDTSSVLMTRDMFVDSTITWLDISSLDMTNVIDAQNMFSGANIKKVSVGPHTPVDMLNVKPHWYMLEGEQQCDNGRIPDGATGVYVIVEKVVMSETAKYLPVGSSPFTLTATIIPDSVKEDVSWSSSNTKVATVDQDGRVTMHAAGNAKINAECLGVRGTCDLYVVSIDVDKTKTIGINASQLKISPTFTPTSITNKQTANWTVSDTSVVKLTKAGKTYATVTPAKAGTTTLTVECAGAYATCEITVAAMSMDQASRTAYLGEDPFQLTANINPGTVDAAVLWKSSDTSVATVDENGRVTPVKKGNATITATLDGVAGVEATCAVTVKDAIVSMDEAEKTVSVKASPFSLGATVMPTTVTQPIEWSSSNESVATVDDTGKVTVHGTGVVDIKAKCVDAEDTCSLTVADLTLNEQEKFIAKGAEPFHLVATKAPASVKENVIWSSTDDSVASVDDTGLVTVHETGKATITTALEGVEGAMDACDVTVCSVTLDEKTRTMGLGGPSHTLNATVRPDGLDMNLVWESSDESVASVDATGVVSAHKSGKATITASLPGIAGASDACEITVCALELNERFKTTGINADPFTLVATRTPGDAVGDVNWSSSNPDVAQVDGNGIVTVKSVGLATITAELAGATDTCELTVCSLILDETAKTVGVGSDPFTLGAVVSPSDMNANIIWLSTNPDVAQVDNNGVVTVKSVGTTDIKAEFAGAVAVCKLTVAEMSFTLDEKTVGADEEPFELPVSVSPPEAAEHIVWSSSDPDVASVDSNGVVTVRSEGVVEITAELDGAKITCTITVASLTLDRGSMAVHKDDSPQDVNVHVVPASLADEIVWSSSNTNVVTIGNAQSDVAQGKASCSLEPKGLGTAVITANLRGVSKSLTFIVTDRTTIMLNEASKTVKIKDEPVMFVLTATVSPDSVTAPISWSTSNAEVASVDGNGVVTVYKEGSCEIIAEVDGARATCLVTAEKDQPVTPPDDPNLPGYIEIEDPPNDPVKPGGDDNTPDNGNNATNTNPSKPSSPSGSNDSDGSGGSNGNSDANGNGGSYSNDAANDQNGTGQDSIFDKPVSDTSDMERPALAIVASLLMMVMLLLFFMKKRKDEEE